MIRLFLLMLSLVLTTSQLPAQSLPEAELKDGFIALINGKDFSGWRFSGTIPSNDKTVKPKSFTSAIDIIPGNWKAGDGMIQLLKGGNPNLASQWDFDDFDVRLQWRAHKKSYNSGFYVRSGKAVGANQINLNQPAVGELINTVPALKDKGKGVPELHKEGGNGEWNDWRVLVVGKKITFWVNGKQAWEIDEFVPARGYLGFQAEGTIDFRNLRIKEIGYEVLREPKAFKGAGWSVKENILSGSGNLSTPKSCKDYTLRLEFRGKGSLDFTPACPEQEPLSAVSSSTPPLLTRHGTTRRTFPAKPHDLDVAHLFHTLATLQLPLLLLSEPVRPSSESQPGARLKVA